MRDCVQFLVATDTHQVRGQLHDGIAVSTVNCVAKIDETVAAMRNAPPNTFSNDLLADAFTSSGSPARVVHRTPCSRRRVQDAVFKTPWPGDPRVNIQRSRGGEAKPYRVRQVRKAIEKLNEEQK